MTETKTLSPKQARAALALESHAASKVNPEAAQAEAAKEPAPEPEPGAEPLEHEHEYSAEQIVEGYVHLVGAMGAAIARRRGLEGETAKRLAAVDGLEVAAVATLAPQALPVLSKAKLPPMMAAGALAVVLAVSLALRAREADRLSEPKAKRADPEPAQAAAEPRGAGGFVPPGWAKRANA